MGMDYEESVAHDQGHGRSTRTESGQPSSGSRRSRPLNPMGPDIAGPMLTIFLGGFPRLAVHNPEVYLTALKATFAEYPQWAGEEACRRLKIVDPEKVPSEGRARKVLEDIVYFERVARGFDREGQKMLTDRATERRMGGPGGSHLYPLRVKPGRPGYEQMIERSRSAPAGTFEIETNGNIWVPLEWYAAVRPGAQFVGA